MASQIDDIARQSIRTTLRDLIPSSAASRQSIELPAGWYALNPSPEFDQAGRFAIIRSVNWELTASDYSVSDPDGAFRTQNYLVRLDDNLLPINSQPLSALMPGGRFPFPVEGVEDVRPFRMPDGQWRATGTMRDRNPAGICQMVLFDLDIGRATLSNPRLLNAAEYHRHEKNWMPFLEGKELYYVYSAAPTVVARYDEQSAAINWDRVTPFPLGGIVRGSSQGIPVEDGWLFVVHEVTGEGTEREYLHRFIELGRDFTITRRSPAFTFAGESIEFCNGLAERDGELLVGYGVRDREAWLARLPLADAMALLQPVVNEPAMALQDLDDDASDEFAEVGSGQAAPDQDPAPVRVVSVTLSGNAQDLIAEALATVVDWVDECLLIDTGITDKTIEIARTVAGDKLTVREWPWRNDYALARNTALEMAAETGADWAVMLDTDERLVAEGDKLREALPFLNVDMINFLDVVNYYEKPRMFRLPARGRYDGPTHEAFLSDVGSVPGRSNHARFWEVPRRPEAYLRKAERDIAILEPHTKLHPREPRWFYYLGDAYSILGRREEAIAAFAACADLNGWPEESAWACYRAAKDCTDMGQYEEALDFAVKGLRRHSGIAELPWIAAWASYQLGRYDMAIHWAHQSSALGFYDGVGEQVQRLIFRHLPALWEGPYDILRYAYRRMGMNDAADLAETAYEEAMAKHVESLTPPKAVLPWEQEDASSDDESTG